MSAVNTRTVTTVRHEYRVPKPAPYGDVSEAMAFARRDMREAGKDPGYDDAAMVDADDDDVIVYWEERQP